MGFGSVAHSYHGYGKGGSNLGGMGRLWEGRIEMFKKGLYSGGMGGLWEGRM